MVARPTPVKMRPDGSGTGDPPPPPGSVTRANAALASVWNWKSFPPRPGKPLIGPRSGVIERQRPPERSRKRREGLVSEKATLLTELTMIWVNGSWNQSSFRKFTSAPNREKPFPVTVRVLG